MNNADHKMEITEKDISAARQNPGGWVYKIDGHFYRDENIPPEAIVGAWQVDENGMIGSEFIPNPRYLRFQDPTQATAVP
jgi:hypothetical protein